MWDAVLFDMDGTVSDTLGNITQAVNYVLDRFGMPGYQAQELKPMLGWGARTLLSRAVPEGTTQEELDRVVECYLPYYAAHAGDNSPPYEGIVPLFRRLKDQGVLVAIISNKPDPAVQPVVSAYFAGLVDLAVGEKPGIQRKPAPDMLENAARELGVRLDRCVYVGDTEVDIQTAGHAGIPCVAVTWGFRSREQLVQAGAETIVDTPQELGDRLLQG